MHVGAVRGQGVGRKVYTATTGDFTANLDMDMDMDMDIMDITTEEKVHSMILDMDMDAMGKKDMAHIMENPGMAFALENTDMAKDTLADMAMENTG